MSARLPAVLAVGLLVVIACGEQPYRHYDTFAEAVAAGEVERGWVPRWMPAAATDLHVQGDLDTNLWWLRMELDDTAAAALRRHLVPVSAESVRVRRPWRSGSWWFAGLVEQQPWNDHALNAELYRGTGEPVGASTVVAFERLSSTVFVWGRHAEP